ncbi:MULTISPECIES: hypothetical protein [Xanthomonas]|uniref:hypothetical protein n=1 Tax=Xanthomonas TaxID=338 RepID=UPI001EDE318E|nr:MULTISPECIES: hypothetical protein [Xanthomonas]
MWSVRTPAASPLQRSVAAPAQLPARAAQGLFDSAMQQLACREQDEQRAAQIAHGIAPRPSLDARRCVAGTPLQIEALLRTAAAHGDANAQRYLLAQRVSELLQRAVAAAPAGMPAQLSASDEQEVAATVAELETLALAGHRDAIETLAQVVESPLLHAPDPVYAAAWRLAARQPPGRALDAAAPLQAEDELLESMPQQQQQQARTLAVEVFGYCCRTRVATAR